MKLREILQTLWTDTYEERKAREAVDEAEVSVKRQMASYMRWREAQENYPRSPAGGYIGYGRLVH